MIWGFEVGGGGWGKLNVPLEKSWLYIPLLVNIAIQMVCLWPVGILNLVGHNEKYWLTTNIIGSTYKVTFFTFYYYFFFYHNPFTPKPHCADSCPLYCLQAKGHQFKIHGQLFLSLLVVKCLPSTVSFCSVYIITFVTLLKPLCCFCRGPHKPVFISQSMP